jgi:hypothetical protein
MDNFNPTEKQAGLFSHLDYAISLSREKSGKEKAKNTERMSWTRILIAAVEAYGKMLEGVQLAEIEERLSKLEEASQPQTMSPINLENESILDRLRREREERAQQEESGINDGETEAPTQIS